jgi:hypothetical protein
MKREMNVNVVKIGGKVVNRLQIYTSTLKFPYPSIIDW